MADCHNGALRPLWLALPFVKRILKAHCEVVAHNPMIAKQFSEALAMPVRVLSDPLPSEATELGSNDMQKHDMVVLVPLSYRKDEPLEELAQAISRLAGHERIRFVLTGNYARAQWFYRSLVGLPNVRFTGYTSLSEYFGLLAKADVIVCLTTDESVQMCALNEALGYAKAVVRSSTATLDEMYPGLGMTVDNTAESFIKVIPRACERSEELSEGARSFREIYEAGWKKSFSELEMVEVR
ncbi:glycosyltransferase [Frateuria hangzhouensis]|uniref:glycosyltransferase n=1 Tax=Frateuria hangzhouensis TaxID=2995589 RepID=UPI002260FEF1|nr:glycosyltransferase [Frateuria sp. STR12]MCX7515314.1 glycosyltransferase [Frateuria sp. STR12]